jgi:membrane protein DedA with SNARE-associated domain
MFDWLTNAVSGALWTYPVVAGVVAIDAFLPIVPGETVVITAAIVAADGDLSVWLVLLAAFVGAFAGDNVSYGLGTRLGRAAARRLFAGERSARMLGWARRQLRERGRLVIFVARFLPGGRTASTFAAGSLGMPWRRFATADLPAAAVWAVYVTALGYFGGAAFEHSAWKPLLLSLGIAVAVSAAGEVARRVATRGGRATARADREEGRRLVEG